MIHKSNRITKERGEHEILSSQDFYTMIFWFQRSWENETLKNPGLNSLITLSTKKETT